MTVTLQPITKQNWRHVYQLTKTLTPEQQHFVAPNGFSMLEAIWDAEEFTARAIYATVDGAETPLGFLMTGHETETKQYWIVRLMIGGEHQGKGYGRAAMQLVIDEFRAIPGCIEVFISFEPQNHAAKKLYSSLGFLDTGRIEYDELVYCLPLRDRSNA